LSDEQEGAEDGPEAVGAVADGVAEGEIFPEGEHGKDGDGDGNGPGRREEDDSDGDGQENKCGENAREGHRERGPLDFGDGDRLYRGKDSRERGTKNGDR